MSRSLAVTNERCWEMIRKSRNSSRPEAWQHKETKRLAQKLRIGVGAASQPSWGGQSPSLYDSNLAGTERVV